jgi:hypothetical protein
MSPMPEPGDVERLLERLRVTAAPEPERLWDAIQAELRAPAPRPAASSLRRRVRSPWLVAAAVMLAVVGGAAGGLTRFYGVPSQWAVRPLAGIPTVDGAPLRGPGTLAAGEWLVTDSASRARVMVGRIGTAEIGPGSRVRVAREGFTGHWLVLERGSVVAAINAPPRLFFLETPSAVATDLGCAYAVDVDSTGSSRLRVFAGWVELKRGDAVALVPAGLVAEVEVGDRPGTPYPRDFSMAARDALHRLDAGVGSASDLDTVLAAMHSPTAPTAFRQRSALSLWYLLQRVDRGSRERIYGRLIALSPPPKWVTKEGILALDRRMLERWRQDLHPLWSEEAQPWWTRLGRRLWEWAIR